MDIATHALIGLVTAAPCLENPPLAAGLLIGSVAPDLDVLSRIFGKRAMICCHQGFTHSVIFLSMITTVVALAAPHGFALGMGFLLGGLVHVFLDFSNTLGVKLFWPVSERRHQKGWVFFLDAFVTLAAVVAIGATLTSIQKTGYVSPWPCASLFMALSLYFCAKASWLNSARSLAVHDLVSIVPSALVPWQFLACTRRNAQVDVSKVDSLKGTITQLETYHVLDVPHADILDTVPEWRLMRELSPAYHVISSRVTDKGLMLLCRDLRVRNFNSTYGDLELQLDELGTTILSCTLHV